MLYCDSQRAIHLAKNHFIIQRQSIYRFAVILSNRLWMMDILILEKILESQNLADILTETVPIEKLKLCTTSIGLIF